MMVKCPWCGTEVSADEYSRHYESCPARLRKPSRKLKAVFEGGVTIYPVEEVS